MKLKHIILLCLFINVILMTIGFITGNYQDSYFIKAGICALWLNQIDIKERLGCQ